MGLVEESQYHGLTRRGRERGHAHVDVTAFALEREATVLWGAAVGDVATRHDLQPTHDRTQHTARRVRRVAEHAVDAEADTNPLAGRLDVNVRRAFFSCLGDHRVDQTDDGCVLSLGDKHVLGFEALKIDRIVNATLHARLGPDSVGALEDLRRVADHRNDRRSGDHLEVVEREDVRGIGDRHSEDATRFGDRNRPVTARDLFGNALGKDLIHGQLVQVDELHAQALRQDTR